jgi:mono/diheme cytochrome c family protein
MYYKRLLLGAVVSSLVGLAAVLNASGVLAAGSDVARGRYLVTVSGCNDCHTPGYAPSDGQTDESLWLTGDALGWRGPWGTTYPANLRLLMQDLSEDQWVSMARTLKTRPPMPWFNLNKMADEDLRAVYQYIRHLGPAGQPAPAYVPPDQQPNPPYVSFPAPPAS